MSWPHDKELKEASKHKIKSHRGPPPHSLLYSVMQQEPVQMSLWPAEALARAWII